MRQKILTRMKALGGQIDQVDVHQDLIDQLHIIKFNVVLYQKPHLTSWLDTNDQEPLIGLNAFMAEQETRLKEDCYGVYEDLIDHYYEPQSKSLGQLYWNVQTFTPFKPNTAHYEQWHRYFLEHQINLIDGLPSMRHATPEFIQILKGTGYPDHYYVCTHDLDRNNPMVYSTDSENFFKELHIEGYLSDFLNCCLSPRELIEMLKAREQQNTFLEFTHV